MSCTFSVILRSKLSKTIIMGLFSFLICINLLGCCVKPVEESKVISIKEKGDEALAFCKSKNMNTEFCVLIDYSIHSGKKRLFVYDFKEGKVIMSGMVSHGCGDNPWGVDATKSKPTFSNVHESHQSSLGKYKVGKRGYSSWGINVNYKMHGLENSNSNAYDRIIVLHSWDMIPHEECYPNGTPEGWGCPAVSNDFMKQLDKQLKNTDKDVLMWCYN